MRVTLTPYEIDMAAAVGVRRMVSAVSKSLADKHGYSGDGWGIHIEGAMGELAVAKALNLYWDGSVDTFRRADISPNIHVKTRSNPDYDLIVRMSDPNEGVFVLVTGRCPVYEVRGWTTGKDAKRDEFLQTYGGREAAYFVPQARLNEMGLIWKVVWP